VRNGGLGDRLESGWGWGCRGTKGRSAPRVRMRRKVLGVLLGSGMRFELVSGVWFLGGCGLLL